MQGKKPSLAVLFLFLMLFGTLAFSEKIEALNHYGYVNDFAGVIDQSLENALSAKLSAFEKNSSVEIAVVTVKGMDGDYIESYAVKLFEKWKIGKKNDNGLLILVALQEREARIEVGYGLEPVITDARAKRIIDQIMVPQFRAGSYYSGIAHACDAVIGLVQSSGDESLVFKEKEQSDDYLMDIVVLLIFFVIFALLLYYRFKIWVMGWLGGTGGYGGLRWGGGGWSGGTNGGFGGFGGGSSGGGGASGRW